MKHFIFNKTDITDIVCICEYIIVSKNEELRVCARVYVRACTCLRACVIIIIIIIVGLSIFNTIKVLFIMYHYVTIIYVTLRYLMLRYAMLVTLRCVILFYVTFIVLRWAALRCAVLC